MGYVAPERGILLGLGSRSRYCQWNKLGKSEPVSLGKISTSARQLQREPLLLLVKHLHMQTEELLQLHAVLK